MTDEKMTDAELKALVAGLATAQDRTDAQMAANAAQQAKTDAKIDRLVDQQAKTDAQMAANAVQQAETDAKIDRLSDKIEELADRLAETEALLKENAIRQAKTDAQLAANAVQQAETDAKIDRLVDQQAETEAKIDRLSDQIAETEALLKENAIRLAETEVLVRETSVEIKELSKMYGGASNNLGAAVEEFFYNSLKAHPVLGGVRFESVERNVPGRDDKTGQKDEFDLLLVNGREVFVVEVKHRAHKDDLDDLLNKKAPKFRRMFPKYAGLRHRFALATFHIHDELKESALEKGVTVLQRKGDVIETSPA